MSRQAKKQRGHKFLVRYSFDKAVTRKEALDAIKDSGHFGVGARDFYGIYRGYGLLQEQYIEGEMRIVAINCKP